MQTNFNKVVVLQQGEHSSVNNRISSEALLHCWWRSDKKEGSDRDIGENEEKGSEVKVQFKTEPLIIFNGPD